MKTRVLFFTAIFFSFCSMSYGQLKVHSTGNVSIGTTTAGSRLLVQKNSANCELTLYSNSSSHNAALWFINNNYGYAIAANSASRLTFYHNYYSPVEVMSIYKKNIMMGTSVTCDTNVLLKIKSVTNQKALWMNHIATTYWARASVAECNLDTTKNWVVLYNNSEKFSVISNGYVYASSGYLLLSDENQKENIESLTGGLNTVLQLRGVSYNYKPEVLADAQDTLTVLPANANPTQYGLIAQEVQALIPEAVIRLEGGLLSINYDAMIPFLIEAIKEQQTRIQDLEQRVNDAEMVLGNCCTDVTVDTKSTLNPNTSSENNQTEGKPNLKQNNPNPFSKKTEIGYFVPGASVSASILIFDMQGKLLKSFNNIKKGEGKIEINAGDLQPGMFLYSLIIDGTEWATKKMILTE